MTVTTRDRHLTALSQMSAEHNTQYPKDLSRGLLPSSFSAALYSETAEIWRLSCPKKEHVTVCTCITITTARA